jgi:TonB family protein
MAMTSNSSLRKIRSVLGLLVALALICSAAFAEDGDRKVRQKVTPLYPELAKRVNAAGTVRLELEVAPSGEVRNVKALGGHPLLIPAAEDAVRKWKYEPMKESTTAVVEFKFAPNQ